jgi:hypothetical protein
MMSLVTAPNRLNAALAVAVLMLLWTPSGAVAQSKLASARALRCTFHVSAVGGWKSDGSAGAALRTPTLILIFESIDADEGTAKMRSGAMLSDIALKVSGGYMHFMQSFRTGPLYTTTVFDKETSGGKFKAVHSRHEYFTIPVPGATSSPEQYYGECEIKS